MSDDPSVPARRLAPKDHLKRAAQSPIASDAERYHLAAARAEAQLHISEHLESIAVSLARLAGCVQTSTYLDGSEMFYLRTEP